MLLINNESNFIFKDFLGSFREVSPLILILATALVPLKVNFSIPGIGGIDLYDMFAVDYLPEVYRKYALFQVATQDHQLDASGWTTSISGQMRIDMKTLKKDTGKLIEDETKTIIGDGKDSINFVDFHIESKKSETKLE